MTWGYSVKYILVPYDLQKRLFIAPDPSAAVPVDVSSARVAVTSFCAAASVVFLFEVSMELSTLLQ